MTILSIIADNIAILSNFVQFFHSGLHSLLHEQLQKLLLADMSIAVSVDLGKDTLDAVMRLFPLQKFGHLFIAYIPGMVDIEVFKGTLIVLTLQVALRIESSDHELSVLNLSRTVEIHQTHHHLQTLPVSYALLHDLPKLLIRDRPITVLVSTLEDLLQTDLLGIGQ